MMHACPSCAAPLGDDGICTACGALTRGVFRGLDLGAPQLASAVANGLDFYVLLGVAAADDVRAIARRYRQLRVLFPDDPSGLAPDPARRLALLELAGRVLTDPRLRQIYDQLRAERAPVASQVQRCAGCAAPLPPQAARCAFCGTARLAETQPPAAPPQPDGPPPAEPVDYYALLGLAPTHLLPPGERPVRNTLRHGLGGLFDDAPALAGSGALLPAGPPPPADVDAAALARERQILLAPGYTAAEREARADELEIARRILRDDRRRSHYDALLLSFRQGLLGGGRLDALRHLQDLARAELAESRGEPLPAAAASALLKQALGYLDARLPREAIDLLRRVVAALPRSAEAHAAYVRALLASGDPLALGAFALRQALTSLAALAELGAAEPSHAALAALCRGLLARDAGDSAGAAAELEQAAKLEPQLAPAWRGLAALALGRGATADGLEFCQRALKIDPRDEPALLMLIGAYGRAGQRGLAREAAAQLAALRGGNWSAELVLRELGA